jgi:MYXO-CTERM domain-containing protein
MKRIISTGVFAMLLSPMLAMAGPNTDAVHVRLDNSVLYRNPRPELTCSAGGPTSLLAGVATLGLLWRRRRR